MQFDLLTTVPKQTEQELNEELEIAQKQLKIYQQVSAARTQTC